MSAIDNMETDSRRKANTSRFLSAPRTGRGYVPKYPSRTLADDNLKGYEASRGKQTQVQEEITEPQRIELPVYFNTPRRFYMPKQRLNSDRSSSQEAARNPQIQQDLDLEKKTTVLKRLHDYKMLAFACKRAGKSRDEGRAYYSMGVLYDNLSQYQMAVKSYQDFLKVCKAIGDTHGEALAYNCIGVDYHKLGELSPDNTTLWDQAIYYHTLHKDIADIPGKFLAHINLGLIYSKLGDENRTSVNHQFALRYAIQMSSVTGQSIALGNLSQIGSSKLKGDSERLKLFAERYLELNHELKNKKAESKAYEQLANISFSTGDYETSTKNYYRAMKIAEQNGNRELEHTAKCGFGVANASLNMDKHIQGILSRINKK